MIQRNTILALLATTAQAFAIAAPAQATFTAQQILARQTVTVSAPPALIAPARDLHG